MKFAFTPSRLYGNATQHVAAHETERHASGEYVRGDVHTSAVEDVFLIFKRGMHGVYQHCGEKHLCRCLAEYDFRYNYRIALGMDDEARTDAAIKGAVGERLTDKTPH